MVSKNLSIIDLERELSRRKSALSALESKHKALVGQLRDVEAEMASLLGNGSGKKRGPGRSRNSSASNGSKTARRGRGKNSITLPDAIAQAMEVGAIVSPKEAASLVRKNGYQTKSKTFGVQVASTLAKDTRFKRVGRGKYERVK